MAEAAQVKRILLLAGTSEGRELAGLLARGPARLVVSVATDYGRGVLPPLPGVEVLCGRVNREGFARLLAEGEIDLAIDATHPYAVQVTDNLRAACQGAGVPCLRLLRGEGEYDGAWAEVPTPEAAAARLRGEGGNILLTTGSRDLAAFTAIPDYRERLFVRVLPAVPSLSHCLELGIPGAHILAMQGPFTKAFNQAVLRHVDARFLVTKASGDLGGVEEKLAAARELGVKTVVIARPRTEEGHPWQKLLEILARQGLLPPDR